ncbi:hypothetical protein C8R43DRAFT_1143981 [Mycena crocata]|nr:hypothetical protein C8R43DRAFT_1143981 [Mycena crocata]
MPLPALGIKTLTCKSRYPTPPTVLRQTYTYVFQIMVMLTPSWILAAIYLLSAAANTMAQDDHNGTAFYFHPALGACGVIHNDTELVASVPAEVFLTTEDVCSHSVVATYDNKTVTAPIVDAFSDPNFKPDGVGFSPAAFNMLGGPDATTNFGILRNVSWHVL